MAEAEEEPVPISVIQERMNVSQPYVQNYRKRLIQTGIIESPSRGVVRFAIPLLRDYLRERNDQ